MIASLTSFMLYYIEVSFYIFYFQDISHKNDIKPPQSSHVIMRVHAIISRARGQTVITIPSMRTNVKEMTKHIFKARPLIYKIL